MNDELYEKVRNKREIVEEMYENLKLIENLMHFNTEVNEAAVTFMYPENYQEIQNMGFEIVNRSGNILLLRW